jgi:CRP-like cAMP-binding protein/Fe-S-cluster-containing hydrogenase component 2
MAKKVIMMPPAVLPPREGDVPLSTEDYLRITFFARLKRKPSLERYPGTLRLRHYRKGEVVCHQGEAGWTAFYVLTNTDVAALGGAVEAPAQPPESRATVLTVHLALARPPEAPPSGLLRRLGQKLFGRLERRDVRRPRYIPIDAPRDVEYDNREAAVFEGELIGEMSCMHASPRSATVVAERDCYLLEMLRHILDEVQSDAVYQEEMDRVYRERVLQGHLRRLSLFDDLTDEQFVAIRDQVELVRCKVGELICEEHDRPDHLYVVRNGLVRSVKNGSCLVAVDEVGEWSKLCAHLLQGEQESSGVAWQVWQRLPEGARAVVRRGGETAVDRQEIAYGLNQFIKTPPLPDPKNSRSAADLPTSAPLAELVQRLPKDPRQWPDIERRRFGRLYLEAACPGLFRPLAARAGREYILGYQTRGDFIGEIGLITGDPRMATCVAYVHPERGQGHQSTGPGARWRQDEALVELVRIPEKAFRQLLAESPAAAERVKEVAETRKTQEAQWQALPAWEAPGDHAQSSRFGELGLIQGQKLMLIDLDRCTRCDECVRACVNTHVDGRSRLFLDGPRFGKYLVPTSCRSCHDPVCLIGCPVGSIHRGDNREIRIEDWCIGCSLCATNCPYGSIQMHDIGVIPEEGHGWYFCPTTTAGDGWMNPRHSLRRWMPIRTPVLHDADFRAELEAWRRKHGQPSLAADASICFRREFSLDAHRLRGAVGFTVELASPKSPAVVWVNSKTLPDVPRKDNTGKRVFSLDAKTVCAGRNVLAVQVTPTGQDREVLLAVRLDEVHTPTVPVNPALELSEKEVKFRAVVCDLCSDQYGQRPACVTACPHDAAMRVNAHFDFPDS